MVVKSISEIKVYKYCTVLRDSYPGTRRLGLPWPENVVILGFAPG
jgi:hypothetical protein